MKNTKKLLILVLALIALTLAMSISIFAEESTEPTVHEFSDINSFKSAINSAQAGDIIRMTANTTVQQLNDTGAASAGAPTNKAVIIDLNGFTLTTTGSWGGAYIGGGASIINGTIKHTGNTCAIKACNMDRLEDLTIIVESQKTDTGGVSMRNHAASNNYAHINVIKNVKMIGTGNYGIETYGQGEGVDKTKPVIDLIESCEIDSIKYALDLSCSVGTIKDCVLSGSQAGISCKYSNGFVIALNLEGDNDIMGGNCAVYLQTSVTLVADEYTDFINTNGGATFSASETNVNNSTLDIVGFSNVNGALVECAHEIEGGSCTERATCSVCGKVFDYVHTWVEDVSKRVAANCTVQGKAYFNCECGATKEEFIARDPNAHEWVETVVDATHTTVGGKTYNCKYGSCVGEEYTIEIPMIPHEYDDGVVTQPTCTEDGYTTYTCECGHSYTDNVVAALGHNYVAGEEVDGKTVYTCSNCGDSYSCTHNFAIVESADATCTEAGYAKYECSLCGEIKEETTPKEEHTYDWNICGCPKCGTVATPDVEGGNVSTNLGFSVFFASSWSEINANVSASSTYKVIKLTADTTVPSGNNYAKVQNANIYIDLGGHSITSSVGLAPLYLYAADALVNGTIIHNYGRQALYVCNVNLIENIDIIVGATYANNTTGIYLASNASYAAGFEGSTGSYIGSMKNVTIDSKRDANGNYIDNCGLFNHGIEFSNAGSIIGELENVKVYSRGQALTLMAKEIGTMTNCVFDGTNIGLNIGNLQCNINLVNCVVSSETLAVRIGGASSNELSFNFDENTAISSNGSVYYIPDSIKGYVGFESLTTAVALVNGVLYGTLEDAIAAVLASEEEVTTFTLIGDLTLDAPITINKNVHFSFGGGTFKIPTTGDKTFTEMTAPGYTVTAPNGTFVVVEGGVLTVSGNGTLIGNENAIVADGGEAIVTAGSYIGYNPQEFVSTDACVAEVDGKYIIAQHTYDDGVMQDKVTYKVDGDCEVCGFVRGSYAVDYVYYATLEEAIVAATESGYQIVLATDIVFENDTVWDLAGFTFNFNGRNITGNLAIVGGAFNIDVTEYLPDGYCCSKVEKVGYVVSAHDWKDATCTEAKTCSVCGATEGEALGHNYGEWIYNAETSEVTKTCQNGCGATESMKAVATVNGQYYATLQDAINAGGTVVVINNIVVDATIVVNGEVTLDLNGYTVSMADASEATAALIKNNGILTITDGSEAKTGKLSFATTTPSMSNAYASNTISNYGTLVVNGGTIENVSATGSACYAIDGYANSATTINGGIITANKTTVRVFNWTTGSTSTLTVNGGYIYSADGYGINFNMGNVPTVEFAVTGGKIETEDTDYALAVYVVSKGSAENVTINVIGGEFLGNFALNGITSTTMADDKVSISGGTYTGTVICYADPAYGFVTGGTFEGEVSADYMADGYAQINGTVAFCTHENLLAEETLPTCTDKGYTTYTCEDCGYTYVDDETEALGHSYVESERTETEIIYVCTGCGDSYAEDIVTHTHTEVEIPAVLPTPSTDGYTAGVMCSECGEELVAPVKINVTEMADTKDPNFRIASANLSLQENIAVNYKVILTDGYSNAHMVFVFMGKEYVVTESSIEESTGRYVFRFDKTFPEYMQENIEAYVYAETAEGEYSMNKVLEYSIKQYCINQLKKNDAALTKVISDVAYMGAMTQIYQNYQTDNLITDALEAAGYTLDKTAFAGIPTDTIQNVAGDRDTGIDWKSGSLSMGSTTIVNLKFEADSLDGLTVNVEIAGRTYSYTEKDFTIDERGRYVVAFDKVNSYEFGEVITATFEKDGEQVGSTLTYSTNSYLARNYTNTAHSEAARELMKALYTYGISIKAYSNK